LNADNSEPAKDPEMSVNEEIKQLASKVSPLSSPCALSHGSALSPAGLVDALEMSVGSRAGDSSVSNDSTSTGGGMLGLESNGRVGNGQLANSGTSSPTSGRNSVSKSRRRSDRVCGSLIVVFSIFRV
jgi:hypothetical protein